MALPSLEALKSDLFDALESKGYNPIGLDSKGKETPNPEDSDVIRFELTDQNGISAGQAWVGVELKKQRAEDKKNIVLWINPDLMKSPEFDNFLALLRSWRRDKNAGFELKTKKGQLVHDMKKRSIMKEKEKLEEGYYPLGKKSSYSDNVPSVKIILQHTRQLEEGEQRFRNIAKIFVENTNGERFLLPTTRPGLARVFARHVAEGGTPYDDKAKHITTLVEEYTKMAGFVRATKNDQFNESAQRLVNEGINHYNNLRETLSKMTTHKGYVKYFESYTPVLNEESDENSLNELFVRETLDPRIESVLPILSRLSKNLTEMNEVKELDEWAQSLVEGGDGGEASEEVDGDTSGTAGQGGAEDVDINEEQMQTKMADSNEVADVIFQSLKGEKNLNSNDIYAIIDEYEDLMTDEGYQVNSDDVAQILMGKLNIVSEAPGAMTLKHNQNTEKKNLKAFDLDEGAGDAPIDKMSDEDLADYLGVSVKFVKQDRKRAEQAARDKTDDVSEAEDFDDEKFSKMNMAQQTAYMKKNPMPNDINFDKSALQGNKDAEKLMKPAQNKDGTYSFSKGMAHGIDSMQPSMSQVGRTAGKALYRDMPGQLRKEKTQNPEKFQQDYDSLDDAGKAEVDRNLAITDKQAKANYKQYQAGLDKQMTDQGYSKYGYNYNDQPVVGRIKNAGAWLKDKFNEEEDSEEDLDEAFRYYYPGATKAEIKKKVHKFIHGNKGFEEDVEEGLDANQKRVGQLGPTEPVGKNEKNLRGKLVGASESINIDTDTMLLDRITKLAGK